MSPPQPGPRPHPRPHRRRCLPPPAPPLPPASHQWAPPQPHYRGWRWRRKKVSDQGCPWPGIARGHFGAGWGNILYGRGLPTFPNSPSNPNRPQNYTAHNSRQTLETAFTIKQVNMAKKDSIESAGNQIICRPLTPTNIYTAPPPTRRKFEWFMCRTPPKMLPSISTKACLQSRDGKGRGKTWQRDPQLHPSEAGNTSSAHNAADKRNNRCAKKKLTPMT